MNKYVMVVLSDESKAYEAVHQLRELHREGSISVYATAVIQRGTPLHFHSSTTAGSACLMRIRTRASVSPRQSFSSLILASIS